jgi:ABC-type branched-subunit amino acid transport system substrate-binding protein
MSALPRFPGPIAALFARALAAAALAGATFGCSSDDGAAPSDAVTIGLLLPFTGSSSGTASNFERAVLYAADRVNAGGGIHGRPLRIVSADTHSDLARAQSSVEELVAQGATVVVGPESSDIALEIEPYLVSHQVAFMSPLVGTADNADATCSSSWFRLAPAAQDYGQALAKLAIAQGVTSIAILYARTDYDDELRTSATSRFTSLHGTVRLAVSLDPNAQSYASEVNQVRSTNADAIVLSSAPRAGALVVNEFDALSATPPSWFLAPSLKTDLLVQNVAPEALEGARGIAPKIYDTTLDFPNAFGERWQGDQPLEGAYFYYDAIALLAFAMNRATPNADGSFDLKTLNTAIRIAAAPPGEAVAWDEIETGLSRLRAGDTIYYSGLTGPLLFDTCGARTIGATSTWSVHAGRIIGDSN